MNRWSKAVAAAALSAVAAPATAHATQGEQEYSLGMSAGSGAGCSAPLVGPEVKGLFHASDFWAFGAALRDRRCTARWQAGSTSAAVEARWTLDALTWIPSLSGGVGAARTEDGLLPQLRAEASLDWRGQPGWGVSVRVAHERDGWNSSGRWLLTVAWVGYRGRGTGLDL